VVQVISVVCVYNNEDILNNWLLKTADIYGKSGLQYLWKKLEGVIK